MLQTLAKTLKNNSAAKTLVITLLGMLLGVIGLEQFAPDVFSQLEGVLGQTQPGLYQVVVVNDGDTITIDMNGNQERVRFIGIDTPEKNHPQKPVQCFAEAASQHLADLIGDQDVRLEADPTNTNRDRYDRLLRYVYLPDGTFLNQRMIDDGYAFAYLSFPFIKSEDFALREDNARQANLGLWSACRVEYDDGFVQTEPVGD